MNTEIKVIIEALNRVENNLSELRAKNENVFLELDQLMGLRTDLVEKLKPLARQEDLTYSDQNLLIKTTRKFKEVFNLAKLKELKLHERFSSLVKEEVNSAVFKDLEKKGELSLQAVNAVVSKESMTPAVEVKFLKNK